MSDSCRQNSQPAEVTLVVPGRNCASTIQKCVNSVRPLLETGQLREVIVVDDGSIDETAALCSGLPVRLIRGNGCGPGYARNLGWRAAQSELIWFVDSDCVVEPDALSRLLPHLDDPQVAGVGGSYANLYPDCILPTLIHEEIVARHRRMDSEVSFLATFNVLYRREVLEQTGGFNERPMMIMIEDAEFAFRLHEAGYRLRFEPDSRVGHHHPRRLRSYLKTQAKHGYGRMALYLLHPGKLGGDSYAGVSDLLQPPLAVAGLCLLPCALIAPDGWLVPAVCLGLLMLLQIPMSFRLAWPLGIRSFLFAGLSFVRSFARGLGMLLGLLQLPRFSAARSS